MNKKNLRIFIEKRMILYFWLPQKNELFFDLKQKDGFTVNLYDSEEKLIEKEKSTFNLEQAEGIYMVEIKNEGKEKRVEIELGKNSYVFLLPGFGLVPSHFEENDYILKFCEKELNFWTYIPENLEEIIVQTTLHKNFEIFFNSADGKKEKINWLTHPLSPYNTAIIKNLNKGWYGFEIRQDTLTPFRFLIYEGYPLFLEKPVFPFEYKKTYFDIRDEKEKKINSILKFYSLNQPISINNRFIKDRKTSHLPPIKLSVFVNSGFEYKEVNFCLNKRKKKKLTLDKFLSRPAGWVCGDLHIHSCMDSDGADPPEIIAETAICNGLDFIFISDNPSVVESCKKYITDKFLVLPGQEVASSFFHINTLNIKEDLQKYVDEKAPQKSIKKLIEIAKKYKKDVCLMLNHPSHLPETSKKHGYFRSWWIVDEFEDIRVVENFDFDTWFKKLNEGRRITGLWTTDSHDSSLISPGFKRNYVYVGKNFNVKNLIEGIKKGKVFCTRYPGAMIDFKINGKIPGEEVSVKKYETLNLKIYCESKRPIKYIEIIGNGKIIYTIDGKKSFVISESISLKPEYKWIIAKVYIYEENWRNDAHSMEPLVLSGVVAFTNPVWVKTE